MATARHVRTERGVEFFHAPIGTPITEDEYQELLRQRRLMRSAYDKGHPKRLEAERNVRQARKVRRDAGIKDDEEETPKEPDIFDEIKRRNKELEAKWAAEDAENERQAAAQAKLDKQRDQINAALDYYEHWDPNYDPAREDVAKPLWHTLMGAIDNAETSLDENRRPDGTFKYDNYPQKEWDQHFIDFVKGAFEDNPYNVDDFVDIPEAARRWREQQLDKPSDRSWDNAIWDTWLYLSRPDQLGNSSEARKVIAQQQGWSVGAVSRALERHQRRRAAGNVADRNEDPKKIAESVAVEIGSYQIGSGQFLNKKVTLDRIRKALVSQAKLVPHVIRDIRVSVTPNLVKSSAKGQFSFFAKHLELHPSIFLPSGARLLERMHAERWWVPNGEGTSLHRAVISHEIGHGVAVAAFGRERVPQDDEFWTDFVEAIRDMGVMMIATPSWFTGKKNSGYLNSDIDRWLEKYSGSITNVLSTYGATNADEMLAELWAEYSTNDNPRPPAKVYGDYVRGKVNR